MRTALLLIVACAGPDAAPPAMPRLAIPDAPLSNVVEVSDAPPPDAAIDAPAQVASDEVWLKGSTHVHAKPSGDSSTPIDSVIHWYEDHGYDFIVLTDHNKVSELDKDHDTTGQVAIRAPAQGLIVLAGSELTHNPVGCLPEGDKSKKCRIHVNAIGVTGRPKGKIDWAARKTHDRIEKYQAAFDAAHKIGASLIQINHPQWFWGMKPDVLIELTKRGASLMEIANIQFQKWNAGDKDHPSTEELWDAALQAGATLWGVSSDDAHSYPKGQWPAGGGWIVVRAKRDPQAIVAAMAAGHFYASTGVELARVEREGDDLVIEAAPDQSVEIAWIENGKTVDTTHASSGRRTLPATGYLRADVTRDDGKKAWVQPVRR